MEDVEILDEPMKDVVITIEGKTVEADVTMEDGSKKMEWFWYDIGTITYNLRQPKIPNICNHKGLIIFWCGVDIMHLSLELIRQSHQVKYEALGCGRC